MGKHIDALEIAKVYLLLGVDQECEGDDAYIRVRNEIAYYLTKYIPELYQLAEDRRVTLHNLSEARFLPVSLTVKVDRLGDSNYLGPRDSSVAFRLSHNPIGDLSSEDIESFSLFPFTGKHAVLQVKIIKELYEATDGFRSLRAKAEEIKRIELTEESELTSKAGKKVQPEPGAARARRRRAVASTNKIPGPK
jgi:hypothetical protein